MQVDLTKTKRMLDGFVKDGLVPGASLAFVTQSGVRLLHAGHAALVPEKRLLEADAVYDLASLTKVVATTTAALQCVERGLFTLRTPLAALLPGYPHREVSLLQLMCHTAGYEADDKAYKTLQSKEDMRAFLYQKPLAYAPGTRVEYSDFSYILLGFAVEAVAGELDVYIKEHIFAPLGMRDTGYLPQKRGLQSRCVPTEQTAARGVVCGEAHDGKAQVMGGVSGNAGVFSTAGDLARFVQMLLLGGSREGVRILQPSTVGLLRTCYTEKLNLRRTLGWLCDEPTNAFGDYYSHSCLFHTGFTGTSIYVDFARGCGVVVLTNRIHPSRDNEHIWPVRNKLHNQLLLAFDEAAGKMSG